MITGVVKKGRDKCFDSYSGFQDDGGNNTELSPVLKAAGVTDLIIYGLAMDTAV